MFTSLFSSEVTEVFRNAESRAGSGNGPFPSPADWRDQLIYFLMVDRFNNPNTPPNHVPYNDPNYYGYQGGSFSGIKKQLKYIKQLGVGAIWLSPVLKNLPWDSNSYHGYGIHNFIRAEPKFADNPDNADNELRDLVDAAHKNGMYVIFDIVLNHAGDVFCYDQNPPVPFSSTPLTIYWRDDQGTKVGSNVDITTIQNPSEDSLIWPVELQSNASFRRQGNPASGGDDTIGDFDSLKQLMTSDINVQQTLIKIYQYIIARFDVDGFRIDTLRYLKGNLAQSFGNAIREYALILGKRNFFTFGEVLGGGDEESVIADFIGRNTQTGDDINSLVGVDAALDYPLFSIIVSVLKGFSPPSAVIDIYNKRKQAEQYVLSSHGDASQYFVTFLDNHDMKRRFRWAEPGKESFYDDQVTMAFACLYCLPGIPALYYGTEQGLHGFSSDGSQDPAVREALWGIAPQFSNKTPFYIQLSKIAEVRNKESSLRYGRLYFRPISVDSIHFGISDDAPGVLAWSRILNDQEVLIVANMSTTNSVAIDVIIDASLSTPGQVVNILYSNKKNPTQPSVVETLSQVIVTEVDGNTTNGPLNSTHLSLQAMEVQVLRCQY